MNIPSVIQYTKPKFKDIQYRQKIAWISGISISLTFNVVLAVLCVLFGVWNNNCQILKTDKQFLQNQLYQCENKLSQCQFDNLQKTCNNTIYKAGDKTILFNYSQDVQSSNSNNITDTIEIKDNGDIYINNKEATTETCKNLPQEIYLTKGDNYYSLDSSNFIKDTPSGTLQGTLKASYETELVLEFNDKQIYPIDENVLGNQIYVTNNKYTTQGPGDYSLNVANNIITKGDIQIWPFKDTIYTAINGTNYMIQTSSNEQFQWTQLDSPTQIKLLENGIITINNKEATTEECKILPQEIYLVNNDNNYYTYDISNFVKDTPQENTIINKLKESLQGTIKASYETELVLELNNKQIYPIDENVLGNQIYVSNNKYTTQGPGNYSLTVAGGEITKDDIQIYPLNEIYTTFNNEIIQIKPSNEILYDKPFNKVLQLNNNNTISFNDKQIYPIDEDVLGNQIYVSNNKYTTYGPGDYSLTVAGGNIIKDDIQIYPLKNTVYFEANNTWYSVKGPSKVLSYNPVKKDDKLNGALEIGGSTNPALTIKGIWGNEQSATSTIYINNIAEGENIQQTSLLGKGCKVNNLGVCLSPANGTTVMNFYNITYRTTPNGTETEDIESKKLYMITLPNDKHIQPTNESANSSAENYGGTINIEPGVKVTLSGTYGNNKLTPSGGVINLDQVNLITSNEDTTNAIYYKPTIITAQCNIYDDTLQMCINPLPSTIYSQDENGENIYKVSLPNNVVYKPQQETIQGEIILNKNYQISLSKKFGSETQTPAVSILTNELITSICKLEIDGICLINKDNKLLHTFYSSFDNYNYQINLPQQLYIKSQTQQLTGVLDFNYNGQITLQSGQFGSSTLTPTIDIKDGVKLLSQVCQIMNGTTCINQDSSNTNNITFKYTKDDINYYYTLQGPQEKIYSGDIPVNSSQTDIISTVELGNNKELSIYGTYGDSKLTDTGITITPVNIYGKTNSISIDNKDGYVNNQININTIIDSSSRGIVIDKNIQFKNCQTGISINGKVTGSNNGIYINGDVGENDPTNSTKSTKYGIYQNMGTTIYGQTAGFYQYVLTNIQSNDHGIFINGKIKSPNNGIYIKDATIGENNLDDPSKSTKYGIYYDSGIIYGQTAGFYQGNIGNIQGDDNGISLNGKIKSPNNGIYINGDVGENDRTNSSKSTKYGIYQNSRTIYGQTAGFYQSNNGSSVIQSDNDGISLNGKIKSPNNGIYINGDVGDVKQFTIYGIYQNSKTIYGQTAGFYQSNNGIIQSKNDGILIEGQIEYNKTGIYVDQQSTLTGRTCLIQHSDTCLLDP